jgi:hypothetical protein
MSASKDSSPAGGVFASHFPAEFLRLLDMSGRSVNDFGSVNSGVSSDCNESILSAVACNSQTKRTRSKPLSNRLLASRCIGVASGPAGR